jgi:hypothetical protein
LEVEVGNALISVVLLFMLIGLAFSTMFGYCAAKNLAKVILAVLFVSIFTTLLAECWFVAGRVALTIAAIALMLFMGIRAIVNAL